MSASYLKVSGATKEEAEEKARQEIANIDFMRQPQFYSIHWQEPTDLDGTGQWVATVKYWGLD